MLIDFDEKYSEIHERIQENSKIVLAIRHFANATELGEENKPKYFHIGEIGDIHLGLGLIKLNVEHYFPKIVAEMRLLYKLSGGKASLPKVYARVEKDSKHIGILSEYISLPEGVSIDGICTPFNNIERIFLEKAFSNPTTDLANAVVKNEYADKALNWSHAYETDKRFHIKL